MGPVPTQHRDELRELRQEAPKCYSPRSLDWQGWAGTVATSITGPNPLDFFLWGDMKRLVYETPTPIDTTEDLVARVVEAVHVIRDNVGLLKRCKHSILRSGRQNSLKWVTGNECTAICTVVEKGEEGFPLATTDA
ncbi:hypothetical protein ANN_15470 [Periplaneta americana]|uniref:Uncharacterized protein n=1 Tax=Periplaneta americana TaxID=6978 RepID=A0ABQ8SGG7_PERAM|nr:hypothetical protein ANN_15470 [Periplaneta americana]